MASIQDWFHHSQLFLFHSYIPFIHIRAVFRTFSAVLFEYWFVLKNFILYLTEFYIGFWQIFGEKTTFQGELGENLHENDKNL